MVLHSSLVEGDLHPFAYVQSSNPGAVGQYIAWIDTTDSSGMWRLKVRNTADTGWEDLSNTGLFQNTSAQMIVYIDSYLTSPASDGSFLVLERARGTKTSPTAIQDDDVLGKVAFRGHDGSAFSGTQGNLLAVAAGNWTGSNHGTDLLLQVTPQDSTTIATAIYIHNDLRVEFMGEVTISSMVIDTFLNVHKSTATTNSVDNVAIFINDSTGTAAAGFGLDIRFQADSSNGTIRNMGSIIASWATATDASRKGKVEYVVWDTSASVAMTHEANGSGVPKISFFGVTTVVRAGATDDIKDALTNYGLLQGTSASPLNLDGGTLTAGVINNTGIVTTTVNDATTSNFTAVLNLAHNTTGTPASGIGVAIEFFTETSTTPDTLVGRIRSELTTVTHASRVARMIFAVIDAAATRNILTLGANGSAAEIGFFGTGTTTKQTVTGSRGGNAALASLLTALANYGLITDSSS